MGDLNDPNTPHDRVFLLIVRNEYRGTVQEKRFYVDSKVLSEKSPILREIFTSESAKEIQVNQLKFDRFNDFLRSTLDYSDINDAKVADFGILGHLATQLKCADTLVELIELPRILEKKNAVDSALNISEQFPAMEKLKKSVDKYLIGTIDAGKYKNWTNISKTVLHTIKYYKVPDFQNALDEYVADKLESYIKKKKSVPNNVLNYSKFEKVLGVAEQFYINKVKNNAKNYQVIQGILEEVKDIKMETLINVISGLFFEDFGNNKNFAPVEMVAKYKFELPQFKKLLEEFFAEEANIQAIKAGILALDNEAKAFVLKCMLK